MSASLVGSEMCIRDRLIFSAGSGSFGKSTPPHVPQNVQIVFGRAPQAVSYTHLTLPTICSV
eukprot:14675219-Alexandrium_andersonii.AAC.1